MRSIKTTPGSPVFQARETSLSNTSLAFSLPSTSPEWEFTRSYSLPDFTASMKSAVTATERLKLVSTAGSSLAVMNCMISGWFTLRMAILAPRRIPPCLMTSVATSNARMKETGPLATPPVEPTRSLSGRSREKENPVPPPLLCIRAVYLTASKMDSMESSMGSTKQAESCPSSRPAFIRVGELGRKSRLAISR